MRSTLTILGAAAIIALGLFFGLRERSAPQAPSLPPDQAQVGSSESSAPSVSRKTSDPASSGSIYGPSKSLIESEFRHAWYAIHGESGEKGYGWKLQQLEIGGISADKDAGTANVSIKFTYSVSGRPVTKTGDFVFRRFGGKWEIDDRGGKDPFSPTRSQMTP